MPAAAVPAAISAGAGILQSGMSLSQASAEGKRQKQMMEYMQNYKRQNLTNPYANLQVSTLGADRQREDLARTMSTFANGAAQGGSRAIAALTPNAMQQQIDNEAKIMANLDEQYKQNQQLAAQGQMQVQQLKENREQNDLLGIGNALNVATQNKNSAYNSVAQGLMGIGLGAANGLYSGLGNGAGKQLTGQQQNIISSVGMGLYTL